MSAGAVTLSDIASADWSLKLDAIGEVAQDLDDVAQCIRIILTTTPGSDPLRPTFGADLTRYIDSPIDFATASIVREATAAIRLWEPRVRVRSISVSNRSEQAGAHLAVAVQWELKLSGAPSPSSITTVAVTGGA